MKSVLAFAVAVGALWVVNTAPAQADSYRWCAIYGGNAMDGSKGCWFNTLEQCQATVNGLSGFCQPNNDYSEPAAAHSKRVKKRVS